MRASKYNANILELSLKKQQSLQATVKRDWWDLSSCVSKIFMLLYNLFFWSAFFVNSLVLYSSFYHLSRRLGKQGTEEAVLRISTSLWRFFVPMLIILTGYVMWIISRKKRHPNFGNKLSLAAFILNAVGSVGLMLAAYTALILNRSLSSYAEPLDYSPSQDVYLKLVLGHIVPLGVVIVLSFIFLIMRKRFLDEVTGIYDFTVSRLYKKFTEENPGYTEEMWEDYLDQYNEEIEPAKHKKRHKRKNKKEE